MIRWGILGAGTIAKRFAKSVEQIEDATLVAISRRGKEAAQSTAVELRCERAYADHAELLADENVDAIYLALPHGLHKFWANATLNAGKALLCEKPFCLTAAEVAELAELAKERNILCMEAMKCRFAPVYELVMEESRHLGELLSIDCTLCNDLTPMLEKAPAHYMRDPIQGGTLLDCGIYCASWIEDYLPGIGKLKCARKREKYGVDSYVEAVFDFDGVEARLECAFDYQKDRRATLVFEGGTITVDDLHRPERAHIEELGKEPRTLEAPFEIDDFAGEIVHFCELLQQGKTESERMTLTDSIHAALILDQIREALD